MSDPSPAPVHLLNHHTFLKACDAWKESQTESRDFDCNSVGAPRHPRELVASQSSLIPSARPRKMNSNRPMTTHLHCQVPSRPRSVTIPGTTAVCQQRSTPSLRGPSLPSDPPRQVLCTTSTLPAFTASASAPTLRTATLRSPQPAAQPLPWPSFDPTEQRRIPDAVDWRATPRSPHLLRSKSPRPRSATPLPTRPSQASSSPQSPLSPLSR